MTTSSIAQPSPTGNPLASHHMPVDRTPETAAIARAYWTLSSHWRAAAMDAQLCHPGDAEAQSRMTRAYEELARDLKGAWGRATAARLLPHHETPDTASRLHKRIVLLQARVAALTAPRITPAQAPTERPLPRHWNQPTIWTDGMLCLWRLDNGEQEPATIMVQHINARNEHDYWEVGEDTLLAMAGALLAERPPAEAMMPDLGGWLTLVPAAEDAH